MRKWRKRVVLLTVLMLMLAITACSPVQISGDLTINADGTGTRNIVGKIDKVGKDDNGCTYYYFRLHGDELKAWFENKYAEMVPGSDEWLKITVNDSGANEVVTLSFDFLSFEEHAERLKALGFDPEFAGSYTDPAVTVEDGRITAYSESTGVMTAIMKSIQMALLADDTVYDDACTMNGESLNGGSSDGITTTNGIELVGAGTGPALMIRADGEKAKGLFAEKESEEEGAQEWYNYKAPEKPAEEPEDTQAPEDTDGAGGSESTGDTGAKEADNTDGSADTSDPEDASGTDNETGKQDTGKGSSAVVPAVIVVVIAAAAVILLMAVRKKKK